jgi:alkylhydroperoxidase family enzyme
MALKEGVDPTNIDAVRRGDSPPDGRLAALSTLTRTLIEKRGHLDDADAKAFTTAGFTDDQLLEVITGLALSTMANYTGNVADPPLEAPFQAQAWNAG